MTHQGRLLTSLILLGLGGALALAGCGKPKATPGPDGIRPAVAPAGTPSAGDTGGVASVESKPAAAAPALAARLTPAQIADGIKAIDFHDIDLGVKFAPAVCDTNDKPNDWVVRCRIRVEDSKRDGPGLVEIQMYNRDLVFSEMADGFDKTVDAMTKGSRLATHPDVKVTDRNGVVSHLDILCGQPMDPIGMGMCILEPNPRMMIISAARPASRRSVGTGDMDRAHNVTMTVLVQMKSLAQP